MSISAEIVQSVVLANTLTDGIQRGDDKVRKHVRRMLLKLADHLRAKKEVAGAITEFSGLALLVCLSAAAS